MLEVLGVLVRGKGLKSFNRETGVDSRTQERLIGDAGERAAARGRGWWSPNLGPRGPGIATFIFETLTQLHAALDRAYKLAVSLPDVPLARFHAKTAGLPRTTEAERLVIQRIGQDVFRDTLMDYWGGPPAF